MFTHTQYGLRLNLMVLTSLSLLKVKLRSHGPTSTLKLLGRSSQVLSELVLAAITEEGVARRLLHRGNA